MPSTNKKAVKKDEVHAIRDRVDSWQNDPMGYWREVLGYNRIWRKRGDLDTIKPGDHALWWFQEKIIMAAPDAIRENKAIYVGTGHSLSKDHTCAGIGLWFLQSYRPSLVINTAPTGRQVDDIPWKETRMHWQERRVDLGGRIFTEPRIEIQPDWYYVGFATREATVSRESGGAKFQGFKGKKNVCIIVTEAQGIEDQIYDQIDAVKSGGENVLVIFIGNPTQAKGRFAKGLKDKMNNIVINCSCLESPNYIEQKTVIPGVVTYKWVEQMRGKWGETDPRWVGRVLGQVPDSAMSTVFTESIIEHAKARFGFIAQHSFNRGVAWDPAGEGIDDHVFTGGAEGEVMAKFKKTLMTPTEGALKAVEMCKSIMGSWIIVDCDGSGARDFQALKELPEEYVGNIQLIEFHGSAASEKFTTILGKGSEVKKALYANRRTEASFVTKDRILAGKASINPKDTELIEDLQEDVTVPDKPVLLLLPKDEIKEILGRSPGDGDSFKMFQWACEQNYKEIAYSRQNVAQYAQTDEDLYREAQGIPRYARTDE